MQMNDYQTAASATAVYPTEVGLAYTALGLAGEAGEIANKVKKVYRDGNGTITDADRLALASELGDVMWYVASFASEIGVTLDSVVQANLQKLSDRAERGVLQGSGDER